MVVPPDDAATADPDRLIEATTAFSCGAPACGELVLAPVSPGWRGRSGAQRPHMELTVRGGSAAQRFREPRPGAPISVLPIEPERRLPVPALPVREPAAQGSFRP